MMLEFKQTDTAAEIILTLTENVSISTPTFLFVFTHVTTKQTVIFIKADESLFPLRYNKFTIDPSVLFTGKPPGEWHYEVHEQASTTNLNPSASGAVLEYGKLILDRAVDFEYAMYEEPTSFKAYNG